MSVAKLVRDIHKIRDTGENPVVADLDQVSAVASGVYKYQVLDRVC